VLDKGWWRWVRGRRARETVRMRLVTSRAHVWLVAVVMSSVQRARAPANRSPPRTPVAVGASGAGTMHHRDPAPASLSPYPTCTCLARPSCRPHDHSYAQERALPSYTTASQPTLLRCHHCTLPPRRFRTNNVDQAVACRRRGLSVLCQRLADPYVCRAHIYIYMNSSVVDRDSLPCCEISQRAAGKGRLQADQGQ